MKNVVVAAEAFLGALCAVNDHRIIADVEHAREAALILLDAMDSAGVLDDLDMPETIAA